MTYYLVTIEETCGEYEFLRTFSFSSMLPIGKDLEELIKAYNIRGADVRLEITRIEPITNLQFKMLSALNI